MKKLFSFALVLALILSLSTVAFAATHDAIGTDESAVEATVRAGDYSTVYKVDVVWTDIAFTYTHGTGAVWNPGTHTYDQANDAGWTDPTATVTVTNHTNAAIDIAVALKDGEDAQKSGATIGFANAAFTLDDAAVSAYADVDAADEDVCTMTATGTPTINSGTISWNVVVTISDHVDAVNP